MTHPNARSTPARSVSRAEGRRAVVTVLLVLMCPVAAASARDHRVEAIEMPVPEKEAPPKTPTTSEPVGLSPATEENANPAPPDGSAAEPAAEAAEPTAGGAREKWRRFADAARGLVDWNLFGDRVILRAYAQLQVDGTYAVGDDLIEAEIGELESSIDLRMLTLYAEGTVDRHFKFVLGYDFGPDASLGNAFIEGIDRGLEVFGYRIGRFRTGIFQEPFSLERMTSSYDNGFLERSLPVQTFAPGNNIGYMVYDSAAKERLSWAAGFFSFGSKNEQNASNSSLSVTLRLTGLPLWRDDGRRYAHLGLAYSTRDPQSSSTRFRSRPEARFVPFVADTGDIDSSKIQLFGAEAALVNGPLWLQSELIFSKVATAEYGGLGFWGGYVQAGFFLTGEVRPYNRTEGYFGRVVPRVEYRGGVPFKKSRGGAFELTARASNIDLDEGAIDGSKVLDYSFGINWYANRTARVMLNLIRSRQEDWEGDRGTASIFLLRYQYRPIPR
jgi:phosphate-selective porin OprO/OprP